MSYAMMVPPRASSTRIVNGSAAPTPSKGSEARTGASGRTAHSRRVTSRSPWSTRNTQLRAPIAPTVTSSVDPTSPFGGYKNSGIGRENHLMMLDHYQQTKNLLVSYAEERAGFF